MTSDNRQVVVFDFDGTLTRKDSFLQFIAFVHGRRHLYVGMLQNAHWIAAYFLRIISNERLKQHIFGHFFRGMAYETFCQHGHAFAAEIDQMARPAIVEQLRRHVAAGHTVMVVSASIREWLLPWCERQGVPTVISTEVEVSPDGMLTGRFSTKNCYGPEKVARLQRSEALPTTYQLTVYGDSRGDKDIMALADERHWIGRQSCLSRRQSCL